MICAQRGTSSTGHGMEVVDRWNHYRENVDENPTFAQVDVASGTTPYQKGFRKSFKITNGNQTSGAGGDDYITIDHKIEAQDIANSGWDYTSASSYITLSFWVKSSVAQTFYGYLRSQDGTSKLYPFETGSLTADTWTKVTKTIPGVSGLQFDNDNGHGLQLRLLMFRGTNKTGSTTLDQWQAWNNTVRTPDNTSTWYTTNDATFEITGVQLEVGDVATDFEHRSYGDELARCMRYFQRDGGGQYTGYGMGVITSNAGGIWTMPLPVPMRAAPTITNDGNVRLYDGSTNANVTAWNTNRSTVKNFWIEPQTASSSFTVGRAFLVGNNDTTDGYLNLSAEL
tara:strand:- start:107 stop:1126 length:1020 start_codon:yes stop_codon:yes gene_type:complete